MYIVHAYAKINRIGWMLLQSCVFFPFLCVVIFNETKQKNAKQNRKKENPKKETTLKCSTQIYKHFSLNAMFSTATTTKTTTTNVFNVSTVLCQNLSPCLLQGCLVCALVDAFSLPCSLCHSCHCAHAKSKSIRKNTTHTQILYFQHRLGYDSQHSSMTSNLLHALCIPKHYTRNKTDLVKQF